MLTVYWFRKDVRDSAFLAQLVKIMKIASPNLQRKATSILEFVSVVDPSMDAIISEEVASGLDAVFQQKVFTGIGTNCIISLFPLKTLVLFNFK